MFDVLPFPNIVGRTPEEQIEQMNSYLIQLKETLEFVLMDISVDNLSDELRKTLEGLGANMESAKKEQDEVNQQIVKRALTVDDVTSSAAFERAIMEKMPVFKVNMETGCLEYDTGGK